MADGQGIHTIDTGFVRPGFDAAYLLVEHGRGAFIDCGTSHSVPAMLAALAAAGLAPEDVDWLILTHVHLDHAGGAGALMQALPAARLLVHPRGARHMIDPSALIAGATAVYGEEAMARDYGRILPVPAERVVQAGDGQVVELAGRALLCLDTPGHAKHHLCVWDAASAGVFSGDTFGIAYRELDGRERPFLFPTSSPVQFEPEALHASIERLMALQPRSFHLTHYGPIAALPQLAADLHAQIDAMTALARACDGRPDRHQCLLEGLTDLYVERARDQGCGLDEAAIERLLHGDIELNAQGLACWLDRDRR